MEFKYPEHKSIEQERLETECDTPQIIWKHPIRLMDVTFMTEYYYKDTPRYMRSRILTKRHRCFYALHLSCALEFARTLRSL